MSQFTPAELRRYSTLPEKIMWDFLKSRRFMGLKFRRQHQEEIENQQEMVLAKMKNVVLYVLKN